MDIEEFARVPVELLRPGEVRIPAEFLLWEQDPALDDPESVRLTLRFQGREISKSASNFFYALCEIRRELQQDGILVDCYGASRNVYPSAMILDMGLAYKAYKLQIGRPASTSDLVSIFETGPDVLPSTVEEQELFYQEWVNSLAQSQR